LVNATTVGIRELDHVLLALLSEIADHVPFGIRIAFGANQELAVVLAKTLDKLDVLLLLLALARSYQLAVNARVRTLAIGVLEIQSVSEKPIPNLNALELELPMEHVHAPFIPLAMYAETDLVAVGATILELASLLEADLLAKSLTPLAVPIART
jgi:hypothetical protein